MNLGEYMHNLQPYRILGDPPCHEPVNLVINVEDLQKLPAWLKNKNRMNIKRIIIANGPENLPIEARLPEKFGKPVFLSGSGHLSNLQEGETAFLFPRAWILAALLMPFGQLANQKIYLAASEDDMLAKHKSLPNYYENNKEKLEKAWSLLHADEDRNVFARRTRAIITGDPGYLPLAPFREYEHPEIGAEAGDILIDGGLSDMVWSQQYLARKIGKSGQAYGFEPIPWMAEKAAAQLTECGNYQVLAKGLCDKSGTACFASLRDSSHMQPEGSADGVECAMTAIDEFAEENSLAKVDLIKLDVEGAELAALKGGKKTIQTHKPKLIICLYHKPRDLFEIPLYIEEICPGYEMKIAHSSCAFTDTILYARHKDAK